MRRTTGGLATIVRLGAEHGVHPDRCLAGTGLTRADLANPEREIDAAQEVHAAANLLDACDEPGLGLIAGSRLHFTTYGVWGLGLISCPTVRDAAAFGLRYLDLTYAVADVHVEADDVEYRIILDVRRLPAKVRTFFLERDMVSMMTLQREVMLARVKPRRLHFTHPAPAHADRYRAIFGIEPSFGARRDFLALDAALLDRPLPLADEHTVNSSERAARELIDRRHADGEASDVDPGFTGQVRAELLHAPTAGLDEVAARLTVSPRTVRRKLAAEGTGFRPLVAEVRSALAKRLLIEDMPVKDVAEQLGYAEPAAFIHAFQRWNGVPPGRYRREAR